MPQHPFTLDRQGLTLRGMTYLPDQPGRVPTAVILHGFTGNRMEASLLHIHLARHLNTLGIAVVTFDFLHGGESDGAFQNMTVTGQVDDALAVGRWLKGQAFVDQSRLALIGFSLGGLVGACVTGTNDLYKTRVLIAPTTVENLCRFAGDNGNAPPVNMGPHQLNPNLFDDLRRLDPLADIVRSAQPTLIVQGSADTAVPPNVSQAYADRLRQANVPVHEKTIHGADHVFGKPAYRDELHEAVGRFLMAHL